MIGKPGPFQIIGTEGCGSLDDPISPPRRRFSCYNYETCLNLAAALNWDNFTCRGCSGQVNDVVLWRARQEFKRDAIAHRLCELPEIEFHCGAEEIVIPRKVAGDR